MQEQEDFQRYKPQYPLPVDISSMSRDDTVCQFCGVSYLIHNEIKALEEKCEKLQTQLAFYSGLSSREEKLEQLLDNERSRVADLQSTIEMNTHKFNALERKFELLNDEKDRVTRSFDETKKFLSKCLSDLRTIRNDYSNLRDFIRKENQNWNHFFVNHQNSLLMQIEQFRSSSLRIQNDLEMSKRENDVGKEKIRQLDQQLIDEEQRRIQLENELNRMRKDVEILHRNHEDLNKEKESRSIVNVELEKVQNEKRKLEEINRTRQAVLDRTRDEYEKLLHKYNDLDEHYREIIEKRDEQIGEIERLQNENDELRKQNETKEITNELQMKKLRDQYAKHLHEAEQWPDRLQAELRREREEHRNQLMDVERRLKENFFTELNIEKEKYNGLLRKYEEENDQSREKLRHELISTEKVTIEQRHYYTKQIEQLEKEKVNLKNELNQLRDILKELHQQIKRQEENEENQMKSFKLKEDLVAKETSLFQAQTTIVELRKDLEQAREEMNTLQETVHRECTEREELKDALIDARQQLLALKKNGVLNGNLSRSLHSPPVAFADIERRVPAPLPYSQAPGLQRTVVPTGYFSDENTRDNSVHSDAARPMSSSKAHPQYRSKALPPIQSQRRSKILNSSSNKADQLLANQRRIARFIKHIK